MRSVPNLNPHADSLRHLICLQAFYIDTILMTLRPLLIQFKGPIPLVGLIDS